MMIILRVSLLYYSLPWNPVLVIKASALDGHGSRKGLAVSESSNFRPRRALLIQHSSQA